ncbi:MAG TPA: hypothetical protein PK759_01420 [Spirochaetales bacterium]|nr:hypothetical protein [Spirochaetales bacterium]HPS14438.1 hypothetical protein [Spirochaetales bacterium]
MKSKISALFLLILVISLVLGSCSTTFKSSNGKLSYGTFKGTQKGTFTTPKANMLSLIAPYVLPLTKPNQAINDLIDPELAKLGANAAQNIQIQYGFDFLGVLVQSITGGLLRWEYITVSGDAVAQ